MIVETTRFLDNIIPEFRERGEPLFSLRPITAYSLRRFYNHGQFFYLCSDVKCLMHYYQQGYHFLGDFKNHFTPSTSIKYSLWDHWNSQDKNYWTVIGDTVQNFGLGHGLSIIKTSPTHVDVFNPATSTHNERINNSYLNNLEPIDKYLSYFLIKEDSFLHNVSVNPFFKPYQIAPHLQSNEQKIKKITYREFQCLELLGKRMTMKTIAKMLMCSPRTVETHIKHIKEKTGLNLKSDLIKISQNYFEVIIMK